MCKCIRGSSQGFPKYLVKVRNKYHFHKKDEMIIISHSEYELQKDNLELIKKIEDINELSIIK